MSCWAEEREPGRGGGGGLAAGKVSFGCGGAPLGRRGVRAGLAAPPRAPGLGASPAGGAAIRHADGSVGSRAALGLGIREGPPGGPGPGTACWPVALPCRVHRLIGTCELRRPGLAGPAFFRTEI